MPTSVNSLNSAASVSSSFPSASRTTGLISFLRPFTLLFGFAVAGASLSIKTVDKQSRNVSKFDSSSGGIISVNGHKTEQKAIQPGEDDLEPREQIPQTSKISRALPRSLLRSRCESQC